MRRLLPALSVLALAAAACGRPDIRVSGVDPEEGAFVAQVVDFEGDAGAGVSLTTDTDGNPHMSYVALPEEGEEPLPADPLAPTLPAVMHAHHVDNIWTRTAVADEQADLTPEDRTAIAVDGEGTHHVAWTLGGALFYSDDPTGESEPQEVAEVATAPAIAADEDGTPWIAFWEQQTDPEGPTALLRLATPEGRGWSVETVAEGEPFDPISIGLGIGPDGPMVAYGSAGETQVATRQGNRWISDSVDAEGGGGVAMDVDADGNPHVSYLGPGGAVKHAHSVGGGPWEVSDVATGGTASATSIAVDDEGTHHVVWQTAEGIGSASNAEGDFAEEELPPATGGGTQPRVAAGAGGSVYVAWYDAEGSELQLLTRSEDRPLLAVPSPTGDAGGGDGPAAACEPEGTELQIAAPPGATASGFDTDCLAVEAGTAFTIAFANDDSTVHNVAAYAADPTTDPEAEHLAGSEPFEQVAPGESATYDEDPLDEAGEFFFRCDFHPTTMVGTFVVAEGGGGGGGE